MSSGVRPEVDEERRVAAVRALGLLDTPREERFDRITRVAARAFGVPIALISLVDANRQWFKSCIGLPERELPRTVSFCARAIMEPGPLVIEDARRDRRFADNRLVTGPPGIVFYAGQPLLAGGGEALGTLCVIDTEPRPFGPEDRELLADVAKWAESELASDDLAEALRSRHATEAALEAARRGTEQLLASAGEGIVGIDRDGRVVFANPAAAEAVGLEFGDLADRHLDEVLPRRDEHGRPLEWAHSPIAATIGDGRVRRGLQRQLVRHDGSVFPAELVITPIHGAHEVEGAVVVFRDVTERHEVDRMKDEFVSVVGHELRTPLTSIRGSLGLLAGGVFGELVPDAERMVAMALANTERLVRLVDDILDLERIAAGHAELVLAQLDGSAVLEDAVVTVRALAEEAGVALRVEAEEVAVHGDRDRLVQALTNLAANAVKFSAAGAEVVLRVGRRDDEVRFAVEDRGRGIPADRLESIFERFAQVDPSDSREKGGTGLGLAIARSIAEQHGGSLTVESEPGRGSVFTLAVPAG